MRTCLAVAIFLVATNAHADISLRTKPAIPEARAKEKQAKRLFEIGKIDEAIETYTAGYVIEANPRFLYNIAFALNRAERHDEALVWIARLKNTFRDFDEESSAEVERLLIEIKTKQAAAEAEAKKSAPKPTTPMTNPAKAKIVRSNRSTPWHHDLVGWTLTGVGVASIATGGLLAKNAADLRGEASNTASERERAELDDRASSRQTLGAVALGLGGAFLVSGVIKLALTSNDETLVSITPTEGRGAFAAIAGTW